MHFTHCSARARNPRAARHHTWTDANIENGARGRSARRRLRDAYRVLRRAGLSPEDARGVLWDAFAAGTFGHLADHDLRYSKEAP